jgi:hypothetical protein
LLSSMPTYIGGSWRGNGLGGRIIFGQGQGQETISGRTRAGNETASAGEFPPRGKPPVFIGDVPSPLAEHH